MEIQVKRKDIIWGYLGTITSMCANLVIIPFILVYLNEDQIGLYYVFAALSSISQLFDFGFAPSVARSVAYIWTGANELKSNGVSNDMGKEPNYKLLLHITHVCKRIYLIMAAIALTLGISIGTFYISYVAREIEGRSHYAAWGIYIVAIVLNILFGYYAVLLRGVGNIEGTNKSMVISRIIQFVSSVVLLYAGYGLIGIAISYLAYGLIYRVLAKRYFFSYNKIGEYLQKEKGRENTYKVFDTVKILWPNTWREGLITLSEYLLNQATTVISSLFLSLYETGLFSFSMQIVTAIAVISMTIFTTYQPTLQSAYVSQNKEVLKKNMSISWFSYVLIYIIGMVCLLTIGKPILKIIKPSFNIEIQVLLLAGLYQFILKYRNCCASYISATNRLIYTGSFVVSAVVCVVFSVIFAKYFGLGMYGLLFAQIMSQLIYNAWRWPIFVHKELNLSVRDVVRRGFSGLLEVVVGKVKHI